jgi:hypothetical protein
MSPRSIVSMDEAVARASARPKRSPSIKVLSDPYQQIRQPVSRKNHPPVSNPARANKHNPQPGCQLSLQFVDEGLQFKKTCYFEILAPSSYFP